MQQHAAEQLLWLQHPVASGQEVQGADALRVGLLLMPQGIGIFRSRSLAGRLTDRLGGRWITLAGFVVVAVATIPFALAAPATNEWLLMAALLLRGVVLGAVTIPLMSVAFLGLERADVPHASVITRITTQIGGSFGVAVLAMILHAATVGTSTGDTLARAFNQSFWWAVSFTSVAAVLSFLRPGRPQPEVAPTTASETGTATSAVPR